MITTLKQLESDVALQIFNVFQRSYKVEAQLIDTHDFPPLARSAEDISHAQATFLGYFESDVLAGVIEVTLKKNILSIDSLTVDPAFFRRGIANKLMRYVLTHTKYTRAIVETAAVNLPAIKLYKRLGFTEYKQWTPSHGIEKIALSVKSTG